MDVIVTDRLRLRRFVADDAPALFDLFRRPEVARWSGQGTPMTHIGEAVTRIEGMTARAGGNPACGVFATERSDTGEFVGSTLLVPLPVSGGEGRTDIEVGWHLHPDAWGHGFATEAGTALIRRAFDAGINEVHAVTHPDNVRSQAVCTRLGMQDLGLSANWYDRELRAYLAAQRAATPAVTA